MNKINTDKEYKRIEEESMKPCPFKIGDRVFCVFADYSNLIPGDEYIVTETNYDQTMYNVNVVNSKDNTASIGCFWPRFELITAAPKPVDYMQITRDIVGGR